MGLGDHTVEPSWVGFSPLVSCDRNQTQAGLSRRMSFLSQERISLEVRSQARLDPAASVTSSEMVPLSSGDAYSWADFPPWM